MELKNSDVTGDGIKWLVAAGSAAIALSLALFWADDTVMGGAIARDKHQAAQMRELRIAQSSLPARVNDGRQTLPLVLEQDNSATSAHNAHK